MSWVKLSSRKEDHQSKDCLNILQVYSNLLVLVESKELWVSKITAGEVSWNILVFLNEFGTFAKSC